MLSEHRSQLHRQIELAHNRSVNLVFVAQPTRIQGHHTLGVTLSRDVLEFWKGRVLCANELADGLVAVPQRPIEIK